MPSKWLIGIAQHRADVGLAGERPSRSISTRSSTVVHRNLRPAVLLQRTGQQTGLGQHLEAVADADHRTAVGGELADRVHDRREAGDGTGPQVVAVGEPAGDDHRVDAADGGVAVPEELGLAAERRDRLDDVELAVRAGEEDDADAWRHQAAAAVGDA